MINEHKFMILIKNNICTADINSCVYDKSIRKWLVLFKESSKLYSYSELNVKYLKNPEIIEPNKYIIKKAGVELGKILAIEVFSSGNKRYWQFSFENNELEILEESELEIKKVCLKKKAASSVFEYLSEIAELSRLLGDQGNKLLVNQYEKINISNKKSALTTYLSPKDNVIKKKKLINRPLIFPFGCNLSQCKAILNALENSFSVIQGPPGTGKTQTILNIVANLLLEGKTVQIVSNNNFATENILEKLKKEEYGLDFLVANLGNSSNKKKFIREQSGEYPDFSSWNRKAKNRVTIEEIKNDSEKLQQIYGWQEKLAILKQTISEVELEARYFESYIKDRAQNIINLKLRAGLKSSDIMKVWQEIQKQLDFGGKISIFSKIKWVFFYGVGNWKFYKKDFEIIITSIQDLYYKIKLKELKKARISLEKDLENGLQEINPEKSYNKHLAFLKQMLYLKYGLQKSRKKFVNYDLWKQSDVFLQEYPIILSTTFSSVSSLSPSVVYDYLIIDEASQVDVSTGALALSCAKNVVVVGDLKQLPNVLSERDKKSSQKIFDSYKIALGYKNTKSFLQSILEVMPKVPQVLLKEHYRCHPKIIKFCNQKFYGGELVAMTEDRGEKDVLSVIKTVEGNHERNHYSQRQVEVIKSEVLPKLKEEYNKIGIIAPYNNQVNALSEAIKGPEIATVHKFQGREKDCIIISTVDDKVIGFSDNACLLNVAISRAKKKLCVVVTGNEISTDSNINDLISYIEYNNFEVKKSKINSVFDYLYKQYTKSRFEYLQKGKNISEFDSENLLYTLLCEILKKEKFSGLDVICHQPLNMLICDYSLLDAAEKDYAMNDRTHLDFLIYKKINKKPLLAIEVDGVKYHQVGGAQKERDIMKNNVLEKYNIPLLRLSTNGSGEKEKIMKKLELIC